MSEHMVDVAMHALARHACSTKRLEPVAPRFRIQGFDEELLWPLPPHQVAALRALFPGTSSVIPQHKIIDLDDELAYRSEYKAVRCGINPWHNATHFIDSLTIDTVGDAASWTQVQEDAMAFGTTVHVLPSDAVGGAVTVSYDDRSSTWESVDDCVLGFWNACSVHVAPITSGVRAMLVFRMRREDDENSSDSDSDRGRYSDVERCAFDDDSDYGDVASNAETSAATDPECIATHAQMLDAVAAVADYTRIAVGMRVYHRGALSSMDDLSDNIGDAITFLVSTNVLDVAVFSSGSSDAVLFDPRCHVPASVVAACTRDSLQNFLARDDALVNDATMIDVVFWPKTHRVYFLGFEAATSLLSSYVAGGSTDLLGFKTLREMASATISMLGEELCPQLHVPFDTWASLGACLLEYGDMDLAMDLLSKTTESRFWATPAIVCDWFRALVTRYGWHVVLPPYLNLIERACRSTDAMHMHLMASLVEDNKLCVQQRHATELLDAVLCLLLKRQRSAGQLSHIDRFVNDALRVSLCLVDESTDPLVGGIVATRLPPPILALVESFLPPRWTLVRALTCDTRLQSSLPAALLLLRPSGLALQPYIDLAIHLYEVSTGGVDYDGYVALLQLTHGTSSFDVIFDKALTEGMRPHFWSDLLATPGLQLAPPQTARLVAATMHRFRGTNFAEIPDRDDLSGITSAAQDGARLFAALDDAPGLARLLEYAYALEAAHEAPITFIMDFFVPLHDTCVESQRLEVAAALAAHGLPRLSERLADLAASKGTTRRQRWNWCRRHCDHIGHFAEGEHPSTFELDASRYCTKKAIKKSYVPLRRYPEHIRDVCIEAYSENADVYTLINHPYELVQKMQDAANRLQASLDAGRQGSAKRMPLDAGSSPKCE
ncbi:hypothetical protein SDRG_02203 [Saprolegnia diclina VS20]|uniref:Uncharacterized protein n=1 Tax=Saprolegnia diclina (strain VS20) TaxID=1156394 RepID=T0R014_SAPDV|nr:hypothetical protein SDRG_02203 [Saprolegnia diclina VS20]EQC40301.1 hypothetical protein SDRG_02203 [Saprolegnia diclina VS20]|eukprot:XP_008606000.1 hypothetical protein SDRG_02203 [Saprolegnia diclina VS20]